MLDSPLPCTACGTANPAQALFCFTCGQPLQASATASNTLTGLLTEDHLLKQCYRILTQIGAGGFGAVYKAADMQFGNRLWLISLMATRRLPNCMKWLKPPKPSSAKCSCSPISSS